MRWVKRPYNEEHVYVIPADGSAGFLAYYEKGFDAWSVVRSGVRTTERRPLQHGDEWERTERFVIG